MNLPYGASTYSRSRVAWDDELSVYATHADGWRTFDVDGHGLCDLVMGLGAVILGHRHPHVDDAIRRALARGTCMSLAHPSEYEIAERLLAHFPSGCMIQWGVNGSDATEGACRLARLVTDKASIAIHEDGYHGFHDWSLAGTMRGEGIPFAHNYRFNKIEDLGICDLTDEGLYAAVIIEPDIHPELLKPIREWCSSNGALMIADEVMTWQRYPEWTGCAHYGVTPDLWCLGKSLGNGMPVSAIVGPADVMRRFAPSDQPNAFFSCSWAGHPLSMAAVGATLDVMEQQDGPKRIWKQANEIERQTIAIAESFGLRFNTNGAPFNRIIWPQQSIAKEWRKLMREAGTLIYAAHNLSLAHDANAMQRIIDAWKYVAKNADRLHDAAKIKDTYSGIMRR